MTKEFITERLKLIDLYPDKAKSIAKEYGLKENEVELIRKGRISSQPVIDRDARTVINYISTDAIDRDNEVIEHKGVVLDDYMKNPIVPWAHDYHGLPIGKNLWIKSDRKGLVAKTYFLKHDFAEDVFDLYTEDIKGTGPALKAWSVGFVPLKWKDAKPGGKDALPDERSQVVRRTYKKWLLLEYSAVPVPSNPEALTLMVEKGLIKDKKLVKDIEEFITEAKEGIKSEDINITLNNSMVRLTKEESKELAEKIRRTEEGDVCKELITKPEETDTQIRIPVRDCKVTATITISEKEGITALYCGEVKKIRTYIFSKKEPYKWTMKRALAWVKEHGKKVDSIIEGLTKFKDIDDKAFQEIELIKEIIDWKDKEPKEIKKEKWNKTANENWARFAEVIQPQLIKKIESLSNEVKEIKEGRVLSGKNLKLVKDCREQIKVTGELLDKLIVASEPPKEESILPLIEESKTDTNNLTRDDIPVMIEEVLKGINGVMSGQHKDIQKLFDKKRGKVN